MISKKPFRLFLYAFSGLVLLSLLTLGVFSVAAVPFDAWLPFSREIIVGFVVKLFLALLGLLGIRTVLYYFDDLLGINFKEWFKNVPETSQANYMAARFFAVTLYFALILA